MLHGLPRHAVANAFTKAKIWNDINHNHHATVAICIYSRDGAPLMVAKMGILHMYRHVAIVALITLLSSTW